MKRILLTGMSGTGKSTLIAALAARGYHAVDLDCDDYSEWVDVADDDAMPGSPAAPDRDWVWREDRVRDLLSADYGGALFVSGCAANMGKFYSRFDEVILLSAPSGVIVERLAVRTTNSYGKQPGEAARVLDLIQTVEPLLRKGAGHEIDTRAPLDEVVERVLSIAECGQYHRTRSAP